MSTEQFHPDENEPNFEETWGVDPDVGEQLEHHVSALYRLCEEYGVPMVTHVTHQVGKDPTDPRDHIISRGHLSRSCDMGKLGNRVCPHFLMYVMISHFIEHDTCGIPEVDEHLKEVRDAAIHISSRIRSEYNQHKAEEN